MPVARVFGFCLAGLLVVTVFSSVGAAQVRKRQPVLRWMGQGFGDGYHQCNRGPNSDYYNPYSTHNSLLHSDLYPQLLPDSYPTLYQSRFNQTMPQPGRVAPLHPTNPLDSGQRYPISSSVAPFEANQFTTGQQRRPVRAHADVIMESSDSIGNSTIRNDPTAKQIFRTTEEPKRGFFKTGFRARSLQTAQAGKFFKSLPNGN